MFYTSCFKVPEDPNLVQHVKASLLDFSKPVCYVKSPSASQDEDDEKGPPCARVDHDHLLDMLENLYSTPMEEFTNKQTEESLLEGLNRGGACNVQDGNFMDDEISNGFLDSPYSSDCTSEGSLNEEKPVISSPKDNKQSSLDFGGKDDLHYKRTLSILLGSSTKFLSDSVLGCGSYKSSFAPWKKEALNVERPQVQQSLLKKMLFAVPLMHGLLY